MRKAGCTYVSVSPESGSKRVLKLINKPFNLNHCFKILKKMNECSIYTQACFVLGFPGETDEDLAETQELIIRLTKSGLSEIAQFIITPVPGSSIYGQIEGFTSFSQLNFSPVWRSDYKKLNAFRIKMYRLFLFYKFLYNFKKIFIQPFRFLNGNFKTKMEMTPFRALHVYFLITQCRLKSKFK